MAEKINLVGPAMKAVTRAQHDPAQSGCSRHMCGERRRLPMSPVLPMLGQRWVICLPAVHLFASPPSARTPLSDRSGGSVF